ncbi:uncharacterized protein LOC113214573 isoform X2 [Frankliniella occidentalis]|uniref:Uncharacterized protein LOC113214573 isoform X2 n=1 Tax=Frankliniella occidentalis TaxID=133901 RepID=A0A9C6X743_FRAOC|nr:uncharacterized protein LOC113214573 isoform X2 [Frankliniella occidentalis]
MAGGARVAAGMESAPLRRLRAPVESAVWGWLGVVLADLAGGLVGGLLCLPLLAVGLLLLPCYLLCRRLLLQLHLLWHRIRVCERVSGTEACWLSAGLPVLHAVLVLEAGGEVILDVGRLRDLVVSRVLPQYPRLTARPLAMPFTAGGGMCWVPDADFKISRHIYPADCGGDGLQVYVSQLLDKELPPDRPPWEMRLLPGCGARKSEVVVVLRVHPALGDGDALVRLLCHALADNPMTRPKQVRRCRRGLLRHSLALARATVSGPLAILGWLLLRARDNNLLLGGQDAAGHDDEEAAGGVRVAWSAGIALSKVKRIQQVSRCSLNCVMLAAVGGAVRALLQGCGVRLPPDLQVTLPISMHRHKSRMANHINQHQADHFNHHHHHPIHHHHHHHHFQLAGSVVGDMYPNPAHVKNNNNNNNRCRGGGPLSNKTVPVVIGLPVSVEGAVPRLWATRRCLQYLRAAADPEVVYLASLGGSWAGRLLSSLTDKASIQFATLAGPSSTVLVGGAVLKAVYPLQPAPGRLGIAVSVLTYADQVFVTVASDTALGPAGTLLLQHFNVQIELLWRLLRHRRAPGEARPPPSVRRADVQVSPVGEGELERLASEDVVDGDGEVSGGQDIARLSCLKAEFTSLLHEVRKRQARARRTQDKAPCRRRSEVRVGPARRRQKRAVSFSLPQRPGLSFGGLLGGASPSGRLGDDTVDTPPSTPSRMLSPVAASLPTTAGPTVTISIPEEDQEAETGRHWVRASFERAARRSHANLDPQLAEYFRSVQAPGGAYPCRCHLSDSSPSPSGTGYGSCSNTSQDEDGVEPTSTSRLVARHFDRRRTSSPEQEYEAIAEAYYPVELKNRAKFSVPEESPPEAPAASVTEARRPSCLKKTQRRDSTPSDQSSPSLSTSVLHQLRSYYDESYLAFGDGSPEQDPYRYQEHGEDLSTPEDIDDELPPAPRERTAAFSLNASARSPPRPARSPPRQPTLFLEPPPPSFTCRDADQLQYVDDSDSAATPSVTPANEVVALVHWPPADQRSDQRHGQPSNPRSLSPGDLAVVPAEPCAGASLTSTSPRPKFLTQSSSSSAASHSASPRSVSRHRQFSADNGYFDESVTVSLDRGASLSHDGLSALSGSGLSTTTDSVINLTGSSVSVSASPRASPRSSPRAATRDGLEAFRSLSEESALLPPNCLHPHSVGELSSQNANMVRPTSLIIKKTYRN